MFRVPTSSPPYSGCSIACPVEVNYEDSNTIYALTWRVLVASDSHSIDRRCAHFLGSSWSPSTASVSAEEQIPISTRPQPCLYLQVLCGEILPRWEKACQRSVVEMSNKMALDQDLLSCIHSHKAKSVPSLRELMHL